MICAAWDYLCYSKGWKRYNPAHLLASGRLCLASRSNFPESPPAAAIIFMHPLNSRLSWAVMYVTDSPLSHVATSVGGGDVIDASLEGVIKYPFDELLDEQSYMAIVIPPMTDVQQRTVVEHLHSRLGAGYSWFMAARIGLRATVGLSGTFNWRLYFDGALTLALTAAVIGSLWGFAGKASLAASAIYLVATLLNSARSFVKRGKQSRDTWNV
ncbi:hypothetical protein ACSNOB_21870 [Micromonospora sp. URMC 106]|uniref:hypothetical protein n=1 Tax=Micromonospora sp. URMC 106 TaxID=3423408 RepID=UPI003F1C8CE8